VREWLGLDELREFLQVSDVNIGILRGQLDRIEGKLPISVREVLRQQDKRFTPIPSDWQAIQQAAYNQEFGDDKKGN
jgi:hypothetical protein